MTDENRCKSTILIGLAMIGSFALGTQFNQNAPISHESIKIDDDSSFSKESPEMMLDLY